MDYGDPSIMDENGCLQEGEFENEYIEHYQPLNEFEPYNSVLGDGIHKDKELGISVLKFDECEDLLWAGTRSGHVTSYFGTELQKYTSFRIHPTEEVRSILTLEHGILALTQTTLRSQLRRGIPCFTHTSPNMQDLHSMIYSMRSGRILMGGMQNNLIEFDLATSKELKVKAIESDNGTCAIVKENSRYVFTGDVTRGRIESRDPNSLDIVHAFDAYSGGLTGFEVHGHYLVSCGISRSNRIHHVIQPDRFLMVYDLRFMRAVSPIQVQIVPYHLRFLPSMSSRVIVLSDMGQLQIVDMAALTTPNISVIQIMMESEASMLSMDISPSNQCLAFGDSANQIYLYTTPVQNPVLNPFSRETEFADPVEPLPPMDITDINAIYASVPRPHQPPGKQYLSDFWPERFNKQLYRKNPEIDPEILRSMKIDGGVGYARNTIGMKRNKVPYSNVRTGHYDSGGGDEHGGRGRGSDDKEFPGISQIPKPYRKVAIKLSKMGSDDFDFDRYNRSGFCGLEASLPNSYSNSMLHVFYFTEYLRILMLNHTCNRENCICCELSFLFHMMDISSPGVPCQSSNFLRALRTIPEASALGLIFTDANAVWKVNVPRLMQSWNRFILQQIYNHSLTIDKNGFDTNASFRRQQGSSKVQGSPIKLNKNSHLEPGVNNTPNSRGEDDDNSSIHLFTKLLGINQEKINTCGKCKEARVTDDTSLLCTLVYPDITARDNPKISFSEIVASSMCPEQSTPAWCDKCRKYQPTSQSRKLKSLPEILSLNAGMDNRQDLVFWQTQMELEFGSVCPSDDAKSASTGNHLKQQQAPPPKTKQCRYGQACSRPDCKFWHPEPEEPTTVCNEDISTKCANQGLSWIPHQITLKRHQNGKVTQGSKSEDASNVEETKTYNLYAICYVIMDPTANGPHNIVAAINVGPTYHSRIASAVSQWYIFNDFSINPITPQEAVTVHLAWKVPCLLFYHAESSALLPDIKSLKYINPITSDVFLEDKSVSQRGRKRNTFVPLGPDELPRKGDLVAMDAEFVTLNQEEAELRSDGKVSTVKAAQKTVARVTVVRGSGRFEGTAFIDDYISTQEQVVDYVTKFSGIKPGDLDANYSSKHLTTLKSTYKKLRYLVDIGVSFIGHGLKNDFKVINIVVPPEQVIDTVHLFHLPHHRMVSLKFLAWHFLDKKIQGDTHCSVEDSVTALALYKKYLELRERDALIGALNGLYEQGKSCNWKTPDQTEEEELMFHQQQQLLQQDHHQQKVYGNQMNIRGMQMSKHL